MCFCPGVARLLQWLGAVHRAALPHLAPAAKPISVARGFSEGPLQRLLNEYRSYFNASRPHQGIHQRQPAFFDSPTLALAFIPGTSVSSSTVLGGLHHNYRLVA